MPISTVASEAVAEAGAGEQEAGEGEQVSVDRPLQGAHVTAQRASQSGQGCVTTIMSMLVMNAAIDAAASVADG